MTDFAQAAEAATRELRQLFPETPLLRNEHLSSRYGADIWLKREDLTPVRSYKLRGAFNAMRKVRATQPDQQNFVCASAGNHAQGVAFACRHFGVKGIIFMPVTTPQQKIDKTRVFGGPNVEIVLTGDYFDQTLAAAQAFCLERGAYFLAPFDDADVIEGQASVGVELLEQLGRMPDLVVLPVGGGGLAAGVTSYLHEASAQTEFRFVEPLGGACLAEAVRHGGPQKLAKVNSFVDGAAVAKLGQMTWERLKHVRADQVLLAPEDRVCITMLEMLNVEGIVLEPAGALSIDVLPELADQIRGKTVVCVTSGSNFDFERLPEVKERAQRYAGLKKYFILRMPQRPGALREFLSMLGPDDDVTRFEYMKKSARNFGSILIGIETKERGGFDAFTARMDEAGFAYRDITDDEALAEFLI
ncbi:threonine ammonia-lyase IlvA [Pseudogemmobacter bohemicus]|uniref:threonine ammonia-lyase IlvA n=1 Tax=Pseudogemmobacter bohemicus TaxID=2250708 RepID=UPI000DD2B6D6|nr:threonine ammonia-lyase IlvA [Pseudogemmobacter bohemicus]